jgi:FlgD Ig-like domain/PKD domain
MRKQSLPLAAPLRPRITLTLVAACTAAGAMALPLTAMAPTSARSTHAPAVTIPGEPRYTTFQSPPGVGDDAGEPSIGVNYTTETSFANSGGSIPNGGTVTYFGGFLPYMLKVTFDDCPSPALATWEQKALLTAGTTRVLGDPILFTDHTTGRTFVSQLVGGTPLGSTTEYTDNDGETFNESEGSGLPSCVDHQTYGGGPFHTPLTSPLYPRAVYYASQCISNATCSISLDGGVTFGPGVTMYTIADCVGLHGHLKVGPDGTIYVPNKGCGGNLPLHDSGNQAVIESEDNGTTWSVRPIPTSTSLGLDQTWDPSVAIATDGTVYFAYRAADGSAHTAVSSDKGLTWEHDTDVGAELGIKKCAFPAIVAGDPDRSAFAFYGCTTDGDDGAAEYPGVWYLYIATTFDGGQTWHTINVTPGDPVQRGGICGDGDCRNMLDFFGADIDKEGRVLVGWDDGCIGGCAGGPPNSFTAKATITRQSGGRRMYAAFDPVEPAKAGAPVLSGDRTNAIVHLTWGAPDNGGADITAYKLYRNENGGAFSLVATVTGTSYIDIVNANTHAYRITATNSQGEGPYCSEFTPPPAPTATPCVEPGIVVSSDVTTGGSDTDSAPNIPADGSVNLKNIFVAEPYIGPGVNEIVFTMQVAPSLLSSPPPNSEWYIIWNRLAPDANFDRWYVSMKTNGSGVPTFQYGKFGVPLDPMNPNPNANTPSALGSADAGSYDLASGIIRIVLLNSHAENIGAGQSLTDVNARSFLATGAPGPRSQNTSSDITPNATYTLVGNASCKPNTPPVARIEADVDDGPAPLLVHFDGSASDDPDAGDYVAAYTFNFGDGTAPVTQASPTIAHTYTVPSGGSEYFATLKVQDQHGLESTNVAFVDIGVDSVVSGIHPDRAPKAFRLVPLGSPSSAIAFRLELDRSGPVTVRVYDAAGRRVADLASGSMSAGVHPISWNGEGAAGGHVPAGVYFVRAISDARVQIAKFVVVH